MAQTTDTKVCIDCGQDLPLGYFPLIHRDQDDGPRRSNCVNCTNQRKQKRQEKRSNTQDRPPVPSVSFPIDSDEDDEFALFLDQQGIGCEAFQTIQVSSVSQQRFDELLTEWKASKSAN